MTVQTAGALVLNLGVIAGDNTINIAEKAGGFSIGGDTGTEIGVEVTVGIGTGTLAATSADNAGTATWSVSVPADASYITGTSLDVDGQRLEDRLRRARRGHPHPDGGPERADGTDLQRALVLEGGPGDQCDQILRAASASTSTAPRACRRG